MSNHPPKADDCDIFEDADGRDTKHRIVKSMRYETLLNSFSKIAGFASGPVFGAGIIMAIHNFVGSAAIPATAHGAAVMASGMTGAMAAHATAMGAIGAGIMAIGPAALGIVAVAAGLMAIGIAADYISTRIYQDKQLDMQEFNAKRAGHHIVKELQANNMCLTSEHETPCEQSEKKFTQMVDQQRLQQQALAGGRA